MHTYVNIRPWSATSTDVFPVFSYAFETTSGYCDEFSRVLFRYFFLSSFITERTKRKLLSDDNEPSGTYYCVIEKQELQGRLTFL